MDRPISNFTIIYDVLFRPSEAFRGFALINPWGLALSVFILATFLPLLLLLKVVNGAALASFIDLILIGEIIASLLGWIISTGIYHFVAEIAGGEGRMMALFNAFGLARLPKLTFLPVLALAGLLSGGWKTLWLVAAVLIILGWTCFLYYAAIKEIYGLSGSKALLVLCSPVLIGLVIMAVIAAFFSAWIAQVILGH